MPKLCWILPDELSKHPEAKALSDLMDHLLSEQGERIEFVVLFGSAAKGTWTTWSDLDIFVGLSCDDNRRLVERIEEFAQITTGNLEIFPYARSEWERMFMTGHPLLLEVLEDGIVLFDKGSFLRMREVFRRWRRIGKVVRDSYGWRIEGDLPWISYR